ncbi:MAG: hypothetical protein K2X87_00030 [Gemmataceae bacterium]|nr:hypothetical protein [Gemmataceae bacterium]
MDEFKEDLKATFETLFEMIGAVLLVVKHLAICQAIGVAVALPFAVAAAVLTNDLIVLVFGLSCGSVLGWVITVPWCVAQGAKRLPPGVTYDPVDPARRLGDRSTGAGG